MILGMLKNTTNHMVSNQFLQKEEEMKRNKDSKRKAGIPRSKLANVVPLWGRPSKASKNPRTE